LTTWPPSAVCDALIVKKLSAAVPFIVSVSVPATPVSRTLTAPTSAPKLML
jgi:hypothetical protein